MIYLSWNISAVAHYVMHSDTTKCGWSAGRNKETEFTELNKDKGDEEEETEHWWPLGCDLCLSVCVFIVLMGTEARGWDVGL